MQRLITTPLAATLSMSIWEMLIQIKLMRLTNVLFRLILTKKPITYKRAHMNCEKPYGFFMFGLLSKKGVLVYGRYWACRLMAVI